MIKLECNAISRQLTKIKTVAQLREQYPAWVTQFFSEHRDRISEMLAPLLIQLMGADRKIEVGSAASVIAEAYCDQRRLNEHDSAAKVETDEQLAAWVYGHSSIDQSAIELSAEMFAETAIDYLKGVFDET